MDEQHAAFDPPRRSSRFGLRLLALVAYSAALALLAASPAFSRGLGPAPAPDSLGPWDVGRRTFELTDESRDGRELTVDVWYPVDPEEATGEPSLYDLLFVRIPSEVALDAPPVADARLFFPLVVFSHGNGGVRFQSFEITEALASHGFVVAAPDHTGNTAIDLVTRAPDPEALLRSALDRPRDVSFVIDAMLEKSWSPEDPFFLRVSPYRIGVAGHSFGGFTSLATAGGLPDEVGESFGFDVTLPEDFDGIEADRRVRAIAPMAPASSPLPDPTLERIRVPTLLLGGTRDDTTPIDPEITRPFDRISSRVLLRADLVGAGHFSFTLGCDLVDLALEQGIPPELLEELPGSMGEEGCGPDFLPVDEAKRIAKLYTVAFFRRHLAHDLRFQRFLTEGFARANEPDVRYRRRRPLPPLLRLLGAR